MDRVRVVLMAVLAVAPAAVAAPHKKPAASKPAPAAPAAPVPGMADPEAGADATPGPSAQHGEGEYGGVAPGQSAKAEPNKGKPKKVSKGTLAWIGFESKSGGADVFFQSPGPFELTQRLENGVLVVNLGGLNRLGQNTQRPIDARFFESPVARIAAKKVGAARGKNAHGAGIEVRITFKSPKDAKEGAFRSATEADGMYYAYLSFAGSAPAAGSMNEPEK